MKKINLKTKACGPKGNFNPGIVTVEDDFADALVAAGHATYIETPVNKNVVETASMELPANAAVPGPRGRKVAKAGDEA